MINYEIPKKDDINNIRDTFNGLSWEETLRSSKDQKPKSGSLSLSEIYNYIKTATLPDENIEKIIRSNCPNKDVVVIPTKVFLYFFFHRSLIGDVVATSDINFPPRPL